MEGEKLLGRTAYDNEWFQIAETIGSTLFIELASHGFKKAAAFDAFFFQTLVQESCARKLR